MYFVYKNNMQMYLTKDEIVIKTWNKVYKFVADKKMFESIQTLVGYIGTPKTYEEIEEFYAAKKEFDLNKTMIILLKTKVIMMQDNLEKLQNTLIYRYENAEEIMDRMELEKILAVNINDRMKERIQKAGMRIITEGEGDYLLIWNHGNVDHLEHLFDEYRVRGKKMILAGIHKGYVYSIFCDPTCNDIRKACYLIRSNEEEAKVVNYQIRIAEKILENQCLEYFFAENEQYNFTLIAPDLSVKNEFINYHMLTEKGEKNPVTCECLWEEKEEPDYPEIDTYINQLPFVGYFGSKGCEQMPLPEQTLWLLNRSGDLACKVSAKGDTCESAMVNCIRNTLIYMNGEKDTIISIDDNKENYYFDAIIELLFKADGENVKKIREVHHSEMKAVCFQHRKLPVYMGELWYQGNPKKIYGKTRDEIKRKVRYGLIELGSSVEESIMLAEELAKEWDIDETNVANGNIYKECLDYLKQIGYLVFEKKLAYSMELKDKGLYAGEFLIEGRMTDGVT